MHSTHWRAKLYPWFVWLLASSFLFYKYLLQVSPSVMVTELMQSFSLTGQSMGNLAAFYFYAYLLMQLPVGILLDNFNPKRLITCAIIVCAFGAYLFSQAEHLAIAKLGRVFIGLGGAFSAVGTMKLISLWFPANRFALVSGLMMSVGMLGAVCAGAPLSYMIGHFGWRDAMFDAAILGLILAACIAIFIQDKRVTIPRADKQSMRNLLDDLKAIVKKPQSWIIALYSGLAFAPVSAFAGLWGIPFLMTKYGLDRSHIAAMVSLVFIGFAIGSPLSGWISDKIGLRKPIMAWGTSISLLSLSAIIYLPSVSPLVLSSLLFVFGFFTGFFFVSFANIREIHATQRSGTSIGFINLFNAACGALSEPLIGKLLDMHWQHHSIEGVRVFSSANYHHALLALPIALIVALLLLCFVRESHCRQL